MSKKYSRMLGDRANERLVTPSVAVGDCRIIELKATGHGVGNFQPKKKTPITTDRGDQRITQGEKKYFNNYTQRFAEDSKAGGAHN